MHPLLEVGTLIIRVHIDELDRFSGDHVEDPVVLDVNTVLGPLVINWIPAS
jgi:hypothetical protein